MKPEVMVFVEAVEITESNNSITMEENLTTLINLLTANKLTMIVVCFSHNLQLITLLDKDTVPH
jgi:hypothetical protein